MLSLIAPPLIAAAYPPYLKPDRPFTNTRKLLIKDGWKPIPMHTNDHYEYDGVEKELVRRKYMEVDSCSNDSARCVLYYRKKDACLRVDTIGEHVRGMKVVRWTDECPAPASPAAR
jgi:hypothetical protein